MKSLKFKSELCIQILSGEKTATWRLFDDKDLQKGDLIEFINKDTLEKFGQGYITASETPPTESAVSCVTLRAPFGRPVHHQTESGVFVGLIKTAALESLEDKDWEGHERYSSDEEMYTTYRGYYGDKVCPETELKIIDFTFTSTNRFHNIFKKTQRPKYLGRCVVYVIQGY